MTWHKIIFTADQITGDAYDRVNSAIRDAIFQDPIRYRDVAIFEGRSEFIEKYHTLNSKTSFFTPDAVKYFWSVLEPYSPEPCERPPASEVGAVLAIDDHGTRSRLWA